MRLGLNQPYFFPYIGHYALIKQVDRYIIDDVVQFTDKSWMTRNRILKPQGGWQYIHMPDPGDLCGFGKTVEEKNNKAAGLL